MTINSRAKGHAFERYLVKLWKSLGFNKCLTSRNESRYMDALKVDLVYTEPFYIQAKAVEKLGCVHSILASMPKKKGIYNLVWHKKSRKGSIVAMKEEDFIEIVKLLLDNNIIKPKC
jgi:hypothetical protein